MAAIPQLKSTPSYTWSASNRTYSTGKNVLTQAEVRGYIDAAIQSARSEARRIAEDFLSHGNSAAFETEMKALLRNLHLSSAMVANGGREQMTQSLWGRAGNVIKDQFGYLEAWGRKIDAGEVPLGDAFLARAESYATYAGTVYERFVGDGMIEAGAATVENELGATETHCDDCQGLTDAGPMPIDSPDWIDIGQRSCGGRCDCSAVYLFD